MAKSEGSILFSRLTEKLRSSIENFAYCNYILVPCQSVMIFFFIQMLKETLSSIFGMHLVNQTNYIYLPFLMIIGPLIPIALGIISIFLNKCFNYVRS